MPLLRIVIAWVLMAALPLQGLAAASMLFCDQAAHGKSADSAVHERGAHDHAAHGHEADHHAASKTHHDESTASFESSAATLGQAESSGAVGLASDDHACPICAMCCNLVALSEPLTLTLVSISPAAPPPQGPTRVLTRHTPLPDKPPRA